MATRIKNITLGIPQRVCSHLSIRPILNDIDDTYCNTYIEVFDKQTIIVTPEVLDIDGITVLTPAVTTVEKTVLWTGNVLIPEADYALCWNNKTLMEDFVLAALLLERRGV